MSTWKVILATLVIYSTGLLTGALLVKFTQPPAAARPGAEPAFAPILQERFVGRMQKELRLSPEQVKKVRAILADTRGRLQPEWKKFQSGVQAEVQVIREKVRKELTPAQQERFEALLKERVRRPEAPVGQSDHRRRERARAQTNAPATSTNAVPLTPAPPSRQP